MLSRALRPLHFRFSKSAINNGLLFGDRKLALFLDCGVPNRDIEYFLSAGRVHTLCQPGKKLTGDFVQVLRFTRCR